MRYTVFCAGLLPPTHVWLLLLMSASVVARGCARPSAVVDCRHKKTRRSFERRVMCSVGLLHLSDDAVDHGHLRIPRMRARIVWSLKVDRAAIVRW